MLKYRGVLKKKFLNQIFKDYDEAAAVLGTTNNPTSGRANVRLL
jgi:hypothetical protein